MVPKAGGFPELPTPLSSSSRARHWLVSRIKQKLSYAYNSTNDDLTFAVWLDSYDAPFFARHPSLHTRK